MGIQYGREEAASVSLGESMCYSKTTYYPYDQGTTLSAYTMTVW